MTACYENECVPHVFFARFPSRLWRRRRSDRRQQLRPGISGGLGHLADWHLPGGPAGPPARWAATSNVEVDQTPYPVNRGG